MRQRRALITGATGQDGIYLSRWLVSKGYDVYGIDSTGSRGTVIPSVSYHCVDIGDSELFADLLKKIEPDECYHLAAYHQSSDARSAGAVEENRALKTNVESVRTMLRVLMECKPDCRIFLAGSCHMFGECVDTPQSESTPFRPNSIYGSTKYTAMQLGQTYRQRGMFVCTGILYNHESPLRGPHFVTSRIVQGAVDILNGTTTELIVGNLDAQVDWGFAGDYVEAMYSMLQSDVAEDFIIASGTLHTVRDFVSIAFNHLGLDWTNFVKEDSGAYRPVSASVYHGDIRAIRNRLGWEPKMSFHELVTMMVDSRLTRDV